jgi:hypothetical protein
MLFRFALEAIKQNTKMTELKNPVIRKSRLTSYHAKGRKLVVSLEATDTVSIRVLGCRKESAMAMTFEDLYFHCCRAKAETKRRDKVKARKAKR